MLAYTGLDPRTDLHWITPARAKAVRLLAEGKIDALLTSPPWTQELRAKQIGHVVVNTSVDRPWSQYFSHIPHPFSGSTRGFRGVLLKVHVE
jgi:NitT/TauT family transport system substrate-binding protein